MSDRNVINRKKRLLVPAQVSRRGFMAGGAGLAAAGLLAPTGRLMAQSPVSGGTLRLGLAAGNVADSLDPMLGLTGVVRNVCYATYDTLIELSPDGEVLPSIAESFESNADGSEWVFNIRRGVEFHDGRSLTAADVIYTINRHIAEESTSPMKGLFSVITDMVAETDHQVRITLESGNADFAFYFNDYRACIIADGTTDFSTANGVGGYRLTRWEPGVGAAGERNPNYWKEGRAHVDSYEITSVNDANARVNGLLTGEFDAISEVERRIAELVSGRSGVTLVVTQGNAHATMPMNTGVAPFDDNNVRLALKHGIDREQVIQTAFSGFGSVGNDHPIAPSDRFYNSELPQHSYDPERAAFYLREAGLDGLDVELFGGPAAGVEADQTAQIFQENMAGIPGMALNYTRTPADGYWSNVWMQEPFVMSYWSGRPTADMILSQGYASDASFNEAYLQNPQLDQLLSAARSETDFETRKQMYWDAQEILHGEGGSIIYAFFNLLDAHADRVQGFQADPAWNFAGGRAIDRVWLEG
jgi:peptide/nickel transport system substrate-binding protein